MALTLRFLCRVQCLTASVPTTACHIPSIRWRRSLQTVVVPNLTRGQATAATAFKKSFEGARADSTPVDENADKIPFEELKGVIRYDTLKAITVKPFKMTHMTSVQSAVLPLLPDLIAPYDPTSKDAPPRDLLVKARTGTGKTLAFLVPAIEARLNAIEAAGKKAVQDAGLVSDKTLEGRAKRVFSRTHVGTLVISPTRELATQIANEALRLAHHHDDFEVRLFTGGTSKRLQMRDWMKGRRDIVVATPGRLLDMLHSEPEVKNGLASTQILVLDEADTLLDMGFRDDIEEIKRFLPPTPQRQTFLFSATVSREIQQIARSTLAQKHSFINTVSEDDSPVHLHVPQYHTVLPSAADQIPHTLRLIAHDQLTNPGKSKIILFLNTTKLTQLFATILRELSASALPSLRNTHVYEIHSKRTQESRIQTSDTFRADKSGASILVTSDVSARGVDYPGVTRVIQIGIPAATEQYIHRIGRTGRAGTSGRGDLVLLPWEVGFLTWQLKGIPLKPLTINELKAQVTTLAEAYDADPEGAFKGIQLASSGGIARLERLKPKMYAKGQSAIVDGIPAAVDSMLPSLDEEAIRETFAAMLGFYLSKSPELRVQKGVIVQGCKDWTTGTCGLPVPPYVSDTFLQRLGFSDGRTKRFGNAYDQTHERRAPSTPWGGRGKVGGRTKTRDLPPWSTAAEQDLDPNDPSRDPDQYKTTRYDSPGRVPKFPHRYKDRDTPQYEPRERRDGWGGRLQDDRRNNWARERHGRSEGASLTSPTGYGLRR